MGAGCSPRPPRCAEGMFAEPGQMQEAIPEDFLSLLWLSRRAEDGLCAPEELEK